VPGVTVRDSVLSANSAVEGGGIYNFSGIFDNNQLSNGTLEVQGSTFSGNTASDSGGAIYNLGTATIQQGTLSGNTAGSSGGGVFNAASGTLAVKDSTVLKNVAPLGADIYNLGSLTQDDSTVGVIGP
jgi:predicted outer membrane repeat protein